MLEDKTVKKAETVPVDDKTVKKAETARPAELIQYAAQSAVRAADSAKTPSQPVAAHSGRPS